MPDVSIVISMYDKVSAPLKAIGNNTKAFSKEIQELEQKCRAYEKSQESLVRDISTLKSRLSESNDKVKDATKAWKANKDELNKGMLDKAIAEQTQYKAKLNDTEAALKSQRKAVLNLAEETRKTENRQSGGGSIVGLGKNLAASGILNMLSGSFSGAAGAFLSSAIGEPDAQLASSGLSGLISGAAMGAVAGIPGAVIGAALGGVSGLISGGTKIFEAQDDAFKSSVQDQYSAVQQNRAAELESGKGIAAGRETDLISFSTLFKDKGTAETYLSDLVDMAISRPVKPSGRRRAPLRRWLRVRPERRPERIGVLRQACLHRDLRGGEGNR